MCFTSSENYDYYFYQNFGKKLVAKDSAAAFCGIFEAGPTVRVIVFAGEQSGVNSGEIAKQIASILERFWEEVMLNLLKVVEKTHLKKNKQ